MKTTPTKAPEPGVGATPMSPAQTGKAMPRTPRKMGALRGLLAFGTVGSMLLIGSRACPGIYVSEQWNCCRDDLGWGDDLRGRVLD